MSDVQTVVVAGELPPTSRNIQDMLGMAPTIPINPKLLTANEANKSNAPVGKTNIFEILIIGVAIFGVIFLVKKAV